MCLQENISQDSEARRDLAFAIEAIRKANRLTQRLSEMASTDEEIASTIELVQWIDAYALEFGVEHCSSLEDKSCSGSERNDAAGPGFSESIVRGDRNLIAEAISALVQNSLEATGSSKEVVIHSDFCRADEMLEEEGCYLEPGSYLKVAVVDQGGGMTPHLMTASQGVYCSTKTYEHGVGLGVPLAQSVAERYGGSFLLQSEEGVGTTVTLHLSLVG